MYFTKFIQVHILLEPSLKVEHYRVAIIIRCIVFESTSEVKVGTYSVIFSNLTLF